MVMPVLNSPWFFFVLFLPWFFAQTPSWFCFIVLLVVSVSVFFYCLLYFSSVSIRALPLFSGFFFSGFCSSFPLVLLPKKIPLCSVSPPAFYKARELQNRLLHNRDRGRRRGHDWVDFVADFPASLLNWSSTSR
ncbi:hypothetical protein NC652_010337 [Populus alba x Populus x berolinensis]|nr:hypothetical protein NC652_010337 [Populus alba x Populus x berolinensis]